MGRPLRRRHLLTTGPSERAKRRNRAMDTGDRGADRHPVLLQPRSKRSTTGTAQDDRVDDKERSRGQHRDDTWRLIDRGCSQTTIVIVKVNALTVCFVSIVMFICCKVLDLSDQM